MQNTFFGKAARRNLIFFPSDADFIPEDTELIQEDILEMDSDFIFPEEFVWHPSEDY